MSAAAVPTPSEQDENWNDVQELTRLRAEVAESVARTQRLTQLVTEWADASDDYVVATAKGAPSNRSRYVAASHALRKAVGR